MSPNIYFVKVGKPVFGEYFLDIDGDALMPVPTWAWA
jgi:hypothetical protein